MKFVDLEKFDVIGWDGIPTGYKDNFADGVMWAFEMLDEASVAEVRPRRNKWIAVHGVCTPGGDPYYECPYCGWGRCYGVEHRDPMPEKCPNCEAELNGFYEGR